MGKEAVQKYYRSHTQKVLELHQRWRDENPGYHAEYARNHPRSAEKIQACWAIKSLIRSGRLVRPTMCSKCHKICKPQAHHDDYSLPLAIVWLCQSCHRQLHIERKKNAN